MHVHHAAVVARLQRETSKFHVLSRTGTPDNNFLFLFLSLSTVLLQLKKKFPTYDELNELE